MPFGQGIGEAIAEVQAAPRAESLAVIQTRPHGGTGKVIVYGRNRYAEFGQKRVEIGIARGWAAACLEDLSQHPSASYPA